MALKGSALDARIKAVEKELEASRRRIVKHQEREARIVERLEKLKQRAAKG